MSKYYEHLYNGTVVANDKNLVKVLCKLEDVVTKELEKFQDDEPFDINEEKRLDVYSKISSLLISIQETYPMDI